MLKSEANTKKIHRSRCTTTCMRYLIVLIWMCQFVLPQGVGNVRVDLVPATESGASAKPGGNTALNSRSANKQHERSFAMQHFSTICKRSFKRAIIRAQQAPGNATTSRERKVCLRQPPRIEASTPTSHLLRPVRARKGRRHLRERLRILSLNVGGICTATYDSLMSSYCRRCIMGLGAALHSGASKAGVSSHRWIQIVDIRELGTVVNSQFIHVQERVLGRLLHVRLELDTYCIDLVAIYQYAITQDKTKDVMMKRHRIWTEFSGPLQTLPKRNLLCIAGDFNCGLLNIGGTAGGSWKPKEESCPDLMEFAQLIHNAGLCSLHAWLPSRSYSLATFVHGDGQPQIDYILVRKNHADVRPCQDLNFSPWRGGGRHFGLMASVPSHPGWRAPAAHAKLQAGPAYNRSALDHAVRDDLPSINALRQTLREEMKGKQLDIEQSNLRLLRLCQEHFPPSRPTKPSRPWRTQEIQTMVK